MMILADKVFFNGKIYTMHAPGETVSAIVARDGKIIYAGTDEKALSYPSGETEDLGGRICLPGFIDTHIHTFLDCNSRQNIVLNHAKDIAELVDIMKAHDDGGDGWLIGGGISMPDLAEGRYPNRRELDMITTERPVFIFSHCLHFIMANSAALKLAGISKELTPDDECLTYFEDGEPDGMLREAAYSKFLTAPFGKRYSDPEYRLNVLRDGIAEYPEYGLTTLHCISGLADAPPFEYFDQYHQLDREGALPVRVVVNSTYLPETLNPLTGFGTDMVKVGAKKVYMDGSLGGLTAAMLEPYSDAPDVKGEIFYTLDEMIAFLREAYDAGIEAAVHAIGDASMERLITAAEAVYPKSDEPDTVKRLKDAGLRRLRVIHACVVAPGHIERMSRLPVILDMQPNFINSNGGFMRERIGRERMKYFTPLKSFMDAGLMVTGSSDAPVEPSRPFVGIECAVTRRRLDGTPEERLAAQEAISIYDAVSMYTRNAAYCSSEEDAKGTIEAGKYADFIVLDKDVFETKPEDYGKIRDTKVLKTVLGGRTTWEAAKI
ncbi:MAG: amidohydrolase [Clostridiales Family XIII bacterium]|jgi:predicted amidohydrolase YtcJ|nr:amidohydrolase [Clostridiales Family XIII bacterium]